MFLPYSDFLIHIDHAMPILPWTQTEQYRRWTVENLLERGDNQGAAEWSRRVSIEDLPPHWIPPSRLVYGYANVKTIEQAVAILNEELADWYADQCRETLRENFTGSFDSPSLSSLDLNTLNRLMSLKDKGKIETEFVDRLYAGGSKTGNLPSFGSSPSSISPPAKWKKGRLGWVGSHSFIAPLPRGQRWRNT
jgi:hypothetical protein